MLLRYLLTKASLFITLAWLADQLHVPVPTDIYTLFAFEIVILVLAVPIAALWNSFR
jgi:hypothetical protein